MKKRESTLDFAKGLLIIFVVLGHSIQYSLGNNWLTSQLFFDDVVFKTIYSFHMPLFMMISGYLFFNSNQKNFKTLVLSKLKVIGAPMLTFIFLNYLFQYILMAFRCNVQYVFVHYFKRIFLGTTMWFLLSLLLNIIVVSILTRILRKNTLLFLGMIMIFVISLFIPDSIVLSVHKFMFPFFCLGYILKQNEIPLYVFSKKKIVLCFLTILSVVAVWWFNKETYIYTSGFCVLEGGGGKIFLIDCKRILIALIVSYTFMQYVYLHAYHRDIIVDKVKRIGQMSLFIYGMNITFNTYLSKLLSLLSINFDFNYLIPIVVTVLFVCICCWLYKLLAKSKVTRISFLGKY